MNQPQLGSFDSIPLAAIRPSPTNPRKHFNELELAELQRSIEEMGVTVPLLLRYTINPVHGGTGDLERSTVSIGGIRVPELEIVSGERRYRAAKAAGLTAVPAIVRELSDAEARDLQMVENLNRSDLHPVEEAEGYRVLMAQGATAEDVAKKAGKDLGYVQKRVKLLSLEVDAKQLFLDGHLTLGHALHLARLTPVEQIKAVMFLLGIREWEGKGKTPSQAILTALSPGSYHWMSKEEQERARQRDNAKRKVNVTEAELQHWIRDNVLLQLKGVPWDLGDPDLVPIAGPCTTCPKRTGANAALFQDLTTAEDTCTDPACFATKQKAFVEFTQTAAKTAGTPLLKISAKPSTEKLEQPPVELQPGPLAESKPGVRNVPTVKPVVVTKKTVKAGQWVDAKPGSCGFTVQALIVDGPDQGKTKTVCADQACKVHKHQVQSASRGGSAGQQQETYEQREKREKVLVAKELPVRDAVLAEMAKSLSADKRFLQSYLAGQMQQSRVAAFIAASLKLDFKIPEGSELDDWRANDAAKPALLKYLETAGLPQMHKLAFYALAGPAMTISAYRFAGKGGKKEDRAALWHLASQLDVDADAIATRIEAEQAKAEKTAEPGAAAKTPVKGKKKLSAAEQKKRWAERQKAKPAPTPAPKPRKLSGKDLAAGERAETVVA